MKPLIATSGPADWRAHLADPEKQWKAGYSAMATAQSWDAGFPVEVAEILGDQAELQLAIVEHKVPLPGGGYPSQCDVFALAHADGRDMAVAVEAKVNEPFGPTLAEWGREGSPNKTRRLAGLCDILGLSETPDGAMSYQLLHRTAAAVIEARRFRRPCAVMVVHSFSQEDRWFDAFRRFCGCFGLSAAIGTGTETRLPDGMILRLGWARGESRYLQDLERA